jgi:hypothetical protein
MAAKIGDQNQPGMPYKIPEKCVFVPKEVFRMPKSNPTVK